MEEVPSLDLPLEEAHKTILMLQECALVGKFMGSWSNQQVAIDWLNEA